MSDYKGKYKGAEIDNLLDKAATALQSVPEGYATEEYVNGIVGDISSVLDNIIGLITFTISGANVGAATKTYQAVDGMTWEDWCSSEYSNGEFVVMGLSVRPSGAARRIVSDVSPTDVIIKECTYYINNDSGN